MRTLPVHAELLAEKWQMLPNEETCPVLQRRMYTAPRANTELSEATIVRSWEITGILRVVH